MYAGCCAWIDNRWIQIVGGLIDMDAMTVNLLPEDPDADEDRPIEFMRGTRNALVYRNDGVYLGLLVGS